MGPIFCHIKSLAITHNLCTDFAYLTKTMLKEHERKDERTNGQRDLTIELLFAAKNSDYECRCKNIGSPP